MLRWIAVLSHAENNFGVNVKGSFVNRHLFETDLSTRRNELSYLEMNWAFRYYVRKILQSRLPNMPVICRGNVLSKLALLSFLRWVNNP